MFDINDPRNQYGWRPFDLENWFRYIVRMGWIQYYSQASNSSGETVQNLMALCTREGGIYFWQKHPAGDIIGDHGVALGLGQLHALPGQDPAWLIKPENNIPEVARRLASNRTQIKKYIIAEHSVPVAQQLEDILVFDSYNRGVRGEEQAWEENPDNPDIKTAFSNYGRDCLERSSVMQQLLNDPIQLSVPAGDDATASDSATVEVLNAP